MAYHTFLLKLVFKIKLNLINSEETFIELKQNNMV